MYIPKKCRQCDIAKFTCRMGSTPDVCGHNEPVNEPEPEPEKEPEKEPENEPEKEPENG